MIQTLAARIQLAKMQAEEGQALVEYALILALISVVAIGVLEVIGVNVTSVLGRIGRRLLREVGREALVEGHHRDRGDAGQRFDEALGLERLLAALASQRQREADHDSLHLVLVDQSRELSKPVAPGGPDDAERPGDGSGRVRHRDPGARPAVVEGEDLHFRASAIACLPAASASRRPSGFLPPASASVGRPPPPPPM